MALGPELETGTRHRLRSCEAFGPIVVTAGKCTGDFDSSATTALWRSCWQRSLRWWYPDNLVVTDALGSPDAVGHRCGELSVLIAANVSALACGHNFWLLNELVPYFGKCFNGIPGVKVF